MEGSSLAYFALNVIKECKKVRYSVKKYCITVMDRVILKVYPLDILEDMEIKSSCSW